ncbi:MAG: carbohydrate kinase, partial [Lentisphaeraceae bacterium]|nr:carbohydrate kinase [Lentisphaeraceae bacterium]
ELNIDADLKTQLNDCFSRSITPIWVDNSTAEECAEMGNALSDQQHVLQSSGSYYAQRFTAAQIRKFAKSDPASYLNTEQIHLVSSFITSVLCGKNAGIDYGDAAGMNLLNLKSKTWDKELLDVCADKLADKLPRPVVSASLAGSISSYFVDKYSFNKNCKVVSATGDNPSSLIGCGAAEPGSAIISLGTSDTYFSALAESNPSGTGHIFGNPAGAYMSLICFANGSLTREKALTAFKLNWAKAEKILSENFGSSELPTFLPFMTEEISPNTAVVLTENELLEYPAKLALPALIEAQMLNIKLQSLSLGESPTQIRVTGGASQNKAITQLIADVFQVPVECFECSDSAALGAVIRAAQFDKNITWQSVNDIFIKPSTLTFQPRQQFAKYYDDKLLKIKKLLEVK